MSDKLCFCGHKKIDHIYEEGACRPDYLCTKRCEEFKEEIHQQIPVLNTLGLNLSFGKYKDMLVTQVPRSYLTWMVDDLTKECDIAKAELKRRGTPMPSVEISGHAIDKASLRVLHLWKQLRQKEEGLYTWLMRITLEAREKGEKLSNGKIQYLGMKLVIEEGAEFPSLVTII